MTHENMIEFNQNILAKIHEYDEPGVIKLIENGNEDFYNLCREFVNLAISAKRYKTDGESTIQALYEFTEVDKLANAVQRFMDKHNGIDEQRLLKMIEKRYEEALTNKELNENAGFVPAENTDKPYGYVGKFYNFTVIACWSDIEKDILKKLKK